MNYWLMKNEVSDYCIDDLKKDRATDWTGVRNYQARNFMRDQMEDGDLAFFYHSNANPSGAAGVMKIIGPAKADITQFDKKLKYYDPKATKEIPRWMLRRVQFVKKLPRLVSIQEMRSLKACKDMMALRKGSRLSITPLKKIEWEAILKAAENS